TMSLNRSSLLLGLIVSCAVLCCSAEYLEYEKVRLVDTATFSDGTSNYLFRGNEPKLKVNGVDEFAYDTLVEYMKKNAATFNVTMPDNFLIFDIKLIYGWADEMGDVHIEQWFFGNNTDKGQFARQHHSWRRCRPQPGRGQDSRRHGKGSGSLAKGRPAQPHPLLPSAAQHPAVSAHRLLHPL
ncbi:hypothetical protein SAMD00019534_003320, partial [Acytostelium subglobosum LB1]|uniref:hypothetical protein n=1 Tax=Acytostelium subglobosum LB1 TaxID=1410327 RepID=UPI000644C9A7